jgi:hypothetical protein
VAVSGKSSDGRNGRAELLRAKLGEAAPAESAERLGQQPGELVDGFRFSVVLGEVLVDELLERHRGADEKPPRCNRVEPGHPVR